VFLNLAPFVISILIEVSIAPDNIKCFLNNGSFPIIAFGIVSTNLIYLIENISTEREEYASLKSRTMVYSSIIIFLAAILYIFQSNFLESFTPSQLFYSTWAGIIILIFAIAIGKKMFLLQNKLIGLFEDTFKEQMDNLLIVPPNNQIRF
jgi:formate-dependent nitrite reductase membrane component NrfD